MFGSLSILLGYLYQRYLMDIHPQNEGNKALINKREFIEGRLWDSEGDMVLGGGSSAVTRIGSFENQF